MNHESDHLFDCECVACLAFLCPTHGWTHIVNSGYNSGFAGEGVWWTQFDCGCETMETGEVEDWMIR